MMKNLTIVLPDDIGTEQVKALAANRGWHEQITDPKKPDLGLQNNPQTAADFVATLFNRELEEAYIQKQSNDAAREARVAKAEELRKKFKH